MNKKLFFQLFAVMLVGNYIVAENDFFNKIGRTLNGNGNNTVVPEPAEKISFKDAKNLKMQMRNISKNIGALSADKKNEVKTKVTKLADLVKKYQVDKKK